MKFLLLAHLSTKCSEWAIMIVPCLSSVINFLACVHSIGHIFSLIIINLVRMFVLLKSRISLKMGHVRSKTRSLGQILEKPCVRFRAHIFSLIITWSECLSWWNLGWVWKWGMSGQKSRSAGQILEKPCVRSRGQLISLISMKRGQNVCLDKISDEFEIWFMSGQKLGHLVKS